MAHVDASASPSNKASMARVVLLRAPLALPAGFPDCPGANLVPCILSVFSGIVSQYHKGKPDAIKVRTGPIRLSVFHLDFAVGRPVLAGIGLSASVRRSMNSCRLGRSECLAVHANIAAVLSCKSPDESCRTFTSIKG